MSFIKRRIDGYRLIIRKKLNPLLGKIRRKALNNKDFTIISNNCWGGIVYEHFDMIKNSPTVGMYFFADEYIKFIYNLKHYLSCSMEIVSYNQSRYKDILIMKNQIHCMIGKLDDVEVVLLHYHDAEEAKEKWARRCQRVNYDNLIFKMSEMNCCTEEHLKAFDSFPAERKVLFVSKDYGLKSQIVWHKWADIGEIKNDTTDFKYKLDLVGLINCVAKKV